MSQLIRRLESELSTATDPITRGIVEAKLAGQFARIGRFDEARRRIDALRVSWGAGQSGVVTVWLMLAEGLIQLYESLSPGALDRIRRSQVLGLAMKYSPIVAVASSWKAHIEFEASDFGDMVESLVTAIEHTTPEDHDTYARVSIVLANSFMTCGDAAQSQKWFMRGRDHAAKNGDQASMEALVFNKAAFSLAAARIDNFVSSIDPGRIRLVRMEVESARNLHGLTRNASYTNHVELLNARLNVIEGKYEEAILDMVAVRSKEPFLNHNFLQAYVDLELAFSEFRLGRIEVAASRLQGFEEDALLELDIDEQLIAERMLLEMSRADTRFGDPARRDLRFDDLLNRCRAGQAGLRDRILRFAI